MKHLTLFLFLLLLATPLSASIVNNSGGSGEDSLTVWVNCTDSIGNPTSCDSFFILVAKSGTNTFTFADSGTVTMTGLDSLLVRGHTYYYFHRAVADIDGPGNSGVYAGIVIAKRNSGPLYTLNRFTFQIIARDLSATSDSVGLAARHAAAAIDSLGKTLDTAYAILDTLQARTGSSSGGGEGAYSFTIVALDTSRNQVVPDVSLTVRNSDQSAMIAAGVTNTVGRVSFNLNPATYTLIARSPGLVFPTPQTTVVTGANIDTVEGYAFAPDAPLSPNLCRVYGFLYAVNGSPEPNASISAWLPKGISRSSSLVISPAPVTTRSDASGYFYLDLIPSQQLSPSATQYEITITRSDGTILRKRLTIPSSPTWQLTW